MCCGVCCAGPPLSLIHICLVELGSAGLHGLLHIQHEGQLLVFHQAPHALPVQQGLIRHLKQRRIHLRQLPQPQRDGVADAPVRMPVGYRHEAHL